MTKTLIGFALVWLGIFITFLMTKNRTFLLMEPFVLVVALLYFLAYTLSRVGEGKEETKTEKQDKNNE